MKKLTDRQILEILGTDPRYVSRSQIGGLSPEQIGGLSPDCQEIIGLKNIPILEHPYTQILAAIKSGGLEMSTWHNLQHNALCRRLDGDVDTGRKGIGAEIRYATCRRVDFASVQAKCAATELHGEQ